MTPIGRPADRPIGGFIGLEPTAWEAGQGRADFESDDRLLFWNARAAFAHLLNVTQARRVWLPAYICIEVAEAAARDGREVLFYPVGARLAPDTEALARSLRPRDAVLGVDYFGARSEGLPELAERFPDLTWVQDRAQALWPDPTPWGTHVLYSPRKVVGAPDGGVLVSRRGTVAPPSWGANPDGERLEVARMRAADAEGARNHLWFPAYRRLEAAMTAEPRRISPTAQAIVDGVDTPALAARRRRNAEALLDRVSDVALFGQEKLLAGAPLGVPVLTDDAAAVGARLAAEHIFCARHWAELPSPASAFPAEHDLSSRLLTLPCDHRYDEADMARVAEIFLAHR